jgi:hypothetical protein
MSLFVYICEFVCVCLCVRIYSGMCLTVDIVMVLSDKLAASPACCAHAVDTCKPCVCMCAWLQTWMCRCPSNHEILRTFTCVIHTYTCIFKKQTMHLNHVDKCAKLWVWSWTMYACTCVWIHTHKERKSSYHGHCCITFEGMSTMALKSWHLVSGRNSLHAILVWDWIMMSEKCIHILAQRRM